MKKTGKLLLFLPFLYLMILPAGTMAQEVEVTAELSETNIFNGERVQLTITISGRSLDSVTEPALPEMEGLRWLQASTSRGSQYSLINGRPSVTYTFGFQFIAQKTGKFTVPPITVNVNGNSYQTQSINYTILDPAAGTTTERSPDIYLRIETDTQNPVVGQQIIADIVLYFKSGVEVSSYQTSPGWKAEGFWKEVLNNPDRAQTTSVIINGVRYQRARLLQYSLFPTKAGELTLSPFEISVAVRQQRDYRDPFGFGLNRERMNLQSLPVHMQVKALPPVTDAVFTGAVGHFNIVREVTPAEALVGESIEIKTTISGTGNIPLINKPDYELPAALEKYNPEESTSINRDSRAIFGTKTFTDIVISRNEGTFVIPEVKAAFFNPQSGRYQTVVLPEFKLNVKRDPNAITALPEQVRLNVQPITGLAHWVVPTYTPLHKRKSVWLMLVIPILATMLFYGYARYTARMNTDTAFARSRKAQQNAMQLLNEAQKQSEVKNGYYLLGKAIIQYVSDKFNLPPAGLSPDEIVDALKHSTDENVAADAGRILQKCETIAYAPNATQQGLQNDITKTHELIKAIAKYS